MAQSVSGLATNCRAIGGAGVGGVGEVGGVGGVGGVGELSRMLVPAPSTLRCKPLLRTFKFLKRLYLLDHLTLLLIF